MIKVKKISEITSKLSSALGVYAKEEWELIYPYRKALYECSRRMWVLEVNAIPVCIIGLKFNTLLGTGAEVYFMLCKQFAKHVKELSKFLRRALRRMVRLYGSVTVKVDSEYWVGKKFVEFFGFRNRGRACTTQTSNYDLFELRATWL